MRLSENLLAGLASSIWSALVALAVVPFYIKYLGVESYGLIGFFVTTQALIQLLDMGMAPTINREVARCSASGNLDEAGKLLHSLAVVYWTLAGFIALLVVSLAPLIAGYWLQSTHLSNQTIQYAVMLMGLVLACRWPIGLYQGALMGAQRLSVLSAINIAMVTLANLGAVGILIFVSPTIVAFFSWQACVGIIYTITIQRAAWGVIGRQKELRFEFSELKRIWAFSVGMSGVALLGLLFTQLDKVILSKLLDLEEFGRYMLATTIVSGLYVVIMPAYNVIYPRMSKLVASEEMERLVDLYRMGTRMLAAVLFPMAMVLAVYAYDLVHMWTGSQDIASSVAPVVSLLAIGSAMHGVMYFPYALQLAYGLPRLSFTISAVLLAVWVPLIIIFTMRYGALGGGMAWLVLHIIYLILGTWLTHRRLLVGLGSRWLLLDVGIPLGLSILVGIVEHYAIQGAEFSGYIKWVCGITLALLAFALPLLLTPKLRAVALGEFGWKKIIVSA